MTTYPQAPYTVQTANGVYPFFADLKTDRLAEAAANCAARRKNLPNQMTVVLDADGYIVPSEHLQAGLEIMQNEARRILALSF